MTIGLTHHNFEAQYFRISQY